MKKLILFFTLISFLGTLNAQYTISEKSSLEKIDEYQSNYGKSDVFWKFFNENILGFVLEDAEWMYVISYEPKENYREFGIRPAYLYRRKIENIGDWEKADLNPLFEHINSRTIRMSFDNHRWHNEISPGTSAVEIIETEMGRCVVMLVGIELKNGFEIGRFTDIFLFYPSSHNPKFFEHNERPFKLNGEFKRFPYTRREKRDSEFYFSNDSETMNIRIVCNENSKTINFDFK